MNLLIKMPETTTTAAKEDSKAAPTTTAKLTTLTKEEPTNEPKQDTDPTKIKYAKTEAVSSETEGGITTNTYKLSEPQENVEDKYKVQTHVVKLQGKKRISYDMFFGDKADPEKHLDSLDVSLTG